MVDGTPVSRKRVRYVCYNKTRRRQDCDGQTGYTMHILDDMVVDILHQVFDKMKGASQEMIVGSTFQKKTALLRSNLQRAKTENTKANKEYDSLKAELLKAVQGKSGMPMEILSEVMQGVRQRVIDTSKQVAALTLELEESNTKMAELQKEFERIVSWSDIFDKSEMAVKKMICGYIIKKITVRRDYQLDIEFNITIEQFLNGIDQNLAECG